MKIVLAGLVTLGHKEEERAEGSTGVSLLHATGAISGCPQESGLDPCPSTLVPTTGAVSG